MVAKESPFVYNHGSRELNIIFSRHLKKAKSQRVFFTGLGKQEKCGAEEGAVGLTKAAVSSPLPCPARHDETMASGESSDCLLLLSSCVLKYQQI